MNKKKKSYIKRMILGLLATLGGVLLILSLLPSSCVGGEKKSGEQKEKTSEPIVSADTISTTTVQPIPETDSTLIPSPDSAAIAVVDVEPSAETDTTTAVAEFEPIPEPISETDTITLIPTDTVPVDTIPTPDSTLIQNTDSAAIAVVDVESSAETGTTTAKADTIPVTTEITPLPTLDTIPAHDTIPTLDSIPSSDSTSTPIAVKPTELTSDTLPADHYYRWAIKTNVAYWAATVANIGLEYAFADHFSIDVLGIYSPYTVARNYRMRFLIVQPEFRYWFRHPLTGHFVGLHLNIGAFNVSFNDRQRYQTPEGFYGAGLSYGYSLALSRRWAMEFTVGAGYFYTEYDTYYNIDNGARYEKAVPFHYFGLTKVGINVVCKLGK